jgi:hypothetical protein
MLGISCTSTIAAQKDFVSILNGLPTDFSNLNQNLYVLIENHLASTNAFS